ncbi:hypothetical protein FACS1894195_0550 [Bacteroidia bacterium]|nr:hypothetical protein FACS1894195_0550 [Bacteroidia bacterium]
MILLDLFSGIGGFHRGLSDAGFHFDKVYYSEIDKHAIANYKFNYEKAIHIGAVESVLTSGIERPNIITFGSPCQDFSIAGKRAGMDGERSSLIQEAIAIVAHFRPDIYIWENVEGVFSSNNSEDFWGIIKAFANIGGYQTEWQLVNTSWFLPQNRKRVFLVGRIAEQCTGEIFPLGEDEEIYPQKNTRQKLSLSANNVACTLKASDGCISPDMNYVIQNKHGFNKGGIKEIATTIIASHSWEQKNMIISYTRDKTGKEINYHTKDVSNTLHSHSSGNTSQYILENSTIRTFTDIERERLQGYPDDFTKYGNYDGIVKEIAHQNRAKLTGNSVTVKVVEEIGKKILKNTILTN